MPYMPLKKSAAQSLLTEYGATVDSYYNKNMIEETYSSLDAKVERMETLAVKAYEALGRKGSLEAMEASLNEDIKLLQKDVAALNGLELKKIFLDSISSAIAYQPTMQKEYEDLIEYFRLTAKEEGLNNVDAIATKMYEELKVKLPPVSKKSKSIKRQLAATGLSIDIETGIARSKATGQVGYFKYSDIFVKMSRDMQERIVRYIELNKQKIQKQNINITENSLSTEWLIENIPIENFLKMTKDERKLLFKKYPTLKGEINIQFKEKIIGACRPSKPQYLTRAIDMVLTENDEIFWGATAKNMTGTLGEIQVIYYILVLTNGKKGAKWIGKPEKGQQPHADILLRNLGFQVKNTQLNNAELEVAFQHFGQAKDSLKYEQNGLFGFSNTKEAIENLSNLAPIEVVDAIETMLTMRTFNVEYNWINKKAKRGPNKEFADVRKEIEAYAAKAEKVMALFAASMMYMQESNISGGKSNTLYFIAGVTVKSSATILAQLVKEIKGELKSFKMQMLSTKNSLDPEKQKTIVEYFNAGHGEHNFDFAFQSSYTFQL